METACPVVGIILCKSKFKAVSCCRTDPRSDIGNWSGNDIKNGIFSQRSYSDPPPQYMRDNIRP